MVGFFRKKPQNDSDAPMSDSLFVRMLGRSVCLIVLCLCALGFSAFAYFSADISSNTNKLSAANYDVSVEILSKNGQSYSSAGGVAAFELEPGTYTVTLKKSGSASTGYCEITIGDTKYHTQQLGADQAQTDGSTPSITFTLVLKQTLSVKFVPSWGTSSYYSAYTDGQYAQLPYICAGDIISAGAEENSTVETNSEQESITVYRVQDGDTLSKIANTYGVKLEELIAYNQISNPDVIYTGQEIIIPPQADAEEQNNGEN